MKLSIDGMHCQSCVRRVEKALEKVDGVAVKGVEIGSATIEAKPEQEQAVLEAVRKAGYEVKAA
jgi:copper chaperone